MSSDLVNHVLLYLVAITAGVATFLDHFNKILDKLAVSVRKIRRVLDGWHAPPRSKRPVRIESRPSKLYDHSANDDAR